MTALFLGVFGYVPLWGQNIDYTPEKPDGPAKIQSSLWELATPQAAKPTRDLQDTVVVILVPQLGQASASIDTSSLAALGVKVLAQSKSLMRVSVPASSLLAVSELPGVRFVRRPYRPRSQVTISEGVSRIGALANHSAGVKGRGVKVAIIDGGFKGADQLGLDMPARSRLRGHDFTGEGLYAGEDVHGTACAEIVHDVAPEAELYLYKGWDLADFENAKDRAIRDGIDIISYSATFPAEGFGDGEGLACDIVNDAADKGILWVNAAGNSAMSHYEGFWSDYDSNGWHNFGSEDEVLSFEAEEGDEIFVALTWDDFPITYQNYDLYLYLTNSSGDLERVAESTDVQDNSGGFPSEWIEYKAQESGSYGIRVYSIDARARKLKIWSDHDFEEFAVAKSSIEVPADARGSMSVGAIYHGSGYWNAGRIEEYSSRGPTTDGRIKPELVAPTGVSTASYRSEPYWGTSAAAPHVAGAAALIKSANPSYSRRQLWNALVAAAVDIGPRGRDNDSGYGKLVLPVMQVSANTSPRISSVSPRTVRTNTVVTVSGSNFGSSRGSSSVRIGSVAISSSAFTSWSSTRIRFRIPLNTPPGDLTVRTSEGTSNAIRLQITSPYLTGISPTRAKTGDRLTLTGGNFGTRRGTGYVLFTSNVRPSAADYVRWSNSRIVVKVPSGAQSGNVRVVTSNGTSGTKRLGIESASPQITSISPNRVRYNQVITIRGTAFGANRGTSRVIFHGGKEPNSSQYVGWSDTQIRVRVPAGARTGDVQVVTTRGRASARLTITSPWISGVSPQNPRTNNVVTLSGGNLGSSRGNSSVQIGSVGIPSSSFSSWLNSTIRFRIPLNTPPGNLTVRTSEGTSNAIRLAIRSPYLTRISPTRVKTGDRLTLTGGNFGTTRGTGYVLFTSIRPSASDYVSWSNSRIVVKVPVRAQSGDVRVTTSNGTSGTKSFEIGSASPQITSISPNRVRYDQVITIRGTAFGANRGASRVIFHGGKEASSSQYISWSDTQIQVRVPAGARTGDVHVVTTGGSALARLTITSPWVSRVSPQSGKTNTVITVSGGNFGSSRGSSSVRIGSVVVPSSSFTSWSSSRIRFRIPRNTPPGNLTVRTSEGTSNAIRLQITSPYLTRISPPRIKTGNRLTLAGGNFGTRRGSGYVLFTSNVRSSAADYVSWSTSRIVVRVPARAQSGNVQVVTANGRSGTKRIVVESSPQITSVSPRQVLYNQVVTVTGINFGSSRGSSTVRIGSVAVPSSSLDSWSNTRIRFRVPTNMRSGNLTVRTSKGTSNAILLEILSPYLASVSPNRVKPGDRLTLTGTNFRSRRGSSYVLFAPNVRPSSGDYVTWSDSQIMVKVPFGAQSGEVKVVVTGSQSSGTKRIIVEGEVVESLPSRGLFGYSPPAVSKNPKSVKFGFEGIGEDVAMTWSLKNDAVVDILVNGKDYGWVPVSNDWEAWWTTLSQTDLNFGQNVIEFRNRSNQNRTSSFTRWQLKDVELWKPFNAKAIAGAKFLGPSGAVVASGLGTPFPTPFNAEATIPFVLAKAGPVRLTVYNLMGQQIRMLADGWMAAGAHSMRWDGRTAAGVETASGVYWAVLQAGDTVQTAKLALIR